MVDAHPRFSSSQGIVVTARLPHVAGMPRPGRAIPTDEARLDIRWVEIRDYPTDGSQGAFRCRARPPPLPDSPSSPGLAARLRAAHLPARPLAATRHGALRASRTRWLVLSTFRVAPSVHGTTQAMSFASHPSRARHEDDVEDGRGTPPVQVGILVASCPPRRD